MGKPQVPTLVYSERHLTEQYPCKELLFLSAREFAVIAVWISYASRECQLRMIMRTPGMRKDVVTSASN